MPTTTEFESESLVIRAAEIMQHESRAILSASLLLDHHFAEAVEILTECRGSVVVSGIGKSGLIGAKISATLASTGTPSHFMHSTEAMHGDLGRIRSNDVVLLLSYSGMTDEVISLAAVLRQDNVPVVSISGSANSRLGQLSTAAISIGQVEEACPFNLAPTASTAAMLAIGDALALSASRKRSFTQADFQKRHPGGSLGRTMLPVCDVLRFKVGVNAAVSSVNDTVRQVLNDAERYPRRCGAVLIVDHNNALAGIITDGDIRRLVIHGGANCLDQPVNSVMNPSPTSVHSEMLVKEVLQLIRERRLDEIPVVDDHNFPLGILDVQDLVALKIVDE